MKPHKFMTLLALAALLMLAGCNRSVVSSRATAGLQKTAAEYYNFSVGNLQGRDYSSFLSPAYRNSFTKDNLDALNAGNAPARSSNNRIEKVKAEDVVANLEGNFAMTDVPPSLGFAFESMEPLRWVKAGSRWYLYLGSDAEVGEYGYFPVSIPFPQILEQAPTQVLEEKRRTDTPVLPEGETQVEGGTEAGSG
ncbi:MAG: hypothetical protein H7A35_14020 [Planctomycetales bacterium]|nr:hypothetical protein [bacterium]UNM07956.1 MAG: hypothetical protein H7A35_14020 [Planctomycetales bacterium]